MKKTIMTSLFAIGGAFTLNAATIGVNFVSAGTLPAATSAGFIPAANWTTTNTLTGSGISVPTNAGTTGASLTFSSTNANTVGTASAQGDELLNHGFLFAFSGSVTASVTFTPAFLIADPTFATYDAYVYISANGAWNGSYQANGGTTYYATTFDNNGTNYVDNNTGTSFTYNLASSTTSGSPTTGANYVKFTGLTGNFSLNAAAVGSSTAIVSGFQLVGTVPEVSSAMLGAVGVLALLRRRRA